jgi:hypothetical protein
LASLGHKVDGQAPPLSDESRATIERYLTAIVAKIDGPKDQVMPLLVRAFKTWKTNTPQ